MKHFLVPWLQNLLFCMVIIFCNLSCSLLSPKGQNQNDKRAYLWQDKNSSTPAEIAEEIARISEGQDGTPNAGQWVNNQRKSRKQKQNKNQFDFTQENRHPSSSGKDEKYIVKRGDTLMKIAFEKYGNLYRWREIYEANRNKLSGFNRLLSGMSLMIEGVEYIVIEKNGKPYLIEKGDTLVKISKEVYGERQYWKKLWKNNRQLIHDPNKIYAGFTLYYKSIDEILKSENRGPAAEIE